MSISKESQSLRGLGSLRILRLPAVKELTGLGNSAIYALIKSGDFPAPIKISERASGWPAVEIKAWMDRLIMKRDLAAHK